MIRAYTIHGLLILCNWAQRKIFYFSNDIYHVVVYMSHTCIFTCLCGVSDAVRQDRGNEANMSH